MVGAHISIVHTIHTIHIQTHIHTSKVHYHNPLDPMDYACAELPTEDAGDCYMQRLGSLLYQVSRPSIMDG